MKLKDQGFKCKISKLQGSNWKWSFPDQNDVISTCTILLLLPLELKVPLQRKEGKLKCQHSSPTKTQISIPIIKAYNLFIVTYKLHVGTQFWIHQDFLECYFISIIIYKNPKKWRKSLKFKNIFFSIQQHLSIKTKSTGSNHVDQGKKWVSGQNRHFRQNRVHRVNTGQTMSIRVKNKFRAVSGQNRYFRPKPSSPGQYGSNHVDCHNPILGYSQRQKKSISFSKIKIKK